MLLVPAAAIEPDAAIAPASARASIERWSRSIDLFGRLAPRTRVLPALVSGVVSRGAFDHVIARCRAPHAERQRIA